MIQVLRVKWVLLHFMELVALEDVAKESIVSFFEALEVVLEHLIFCFNDLDFAKGKLRI